MNRYIAWGSLAAFCGVGLGAFGAHVLKTRIPASMLAVYQTGVEYHLVHALGLVLVGGLVQQAPTLRLLHWAGRLLLAGIVLFSGSLYLLAVTGIRPLGMITPFGGVAFLGGWALLALAALKPGPDSGGHP